MERYIIVSRNYLKNSDECHLHPLVEYSKLIGNNENKVLFAFSYEEAEEKIKQLNLLIPRNINLSVYPMDDLMFFELQNRLDKYVDKLIEDVNKQVIENVGDKSLAEQESYKQNLIFNLIKTPITGVAINENEEYIISTEIEQYEE